MDFTLVEWKSISKMVEVYIIDSHGRIPPEYKVGFQWAERIQDKIKNKIAELLVKKG
jgi:hypothetical protein